MEKVEIKKVLVGTIMAYDDEDIFVLGDALYSKADLLDVVDEMVFDLTYDESPSYGMDPVEYLSEIPKERV